MDERRLDIEIAKLHEDSNTRLGSQSPLFYDVYNEFEIQDPFESSKKYAVSAITPIKTHKIA